MKSSQHLFIELKKWHLVWSDEAIGLCVDSCSEARPLLSSCKK